ncbi:MAG: UvrD-helicase domain-containing protein [Desulfobulbaceae bacterium]|nr:UvrD-helicase domain-containing protein [Desulfobulbaceae bacterium]HIJ78756.1 UvrD-helicase domain-containing protein [Deltaproteobacteria bacterium]
MQQTLFSMNKKAVSPSSANRISRMELNEAQYEAVTTVAGAVLVIAGAGSGKTRTLVYRLAHLVEQGIEPEKILLLTFTRKAAQEMLQRASVLLDDSCRRVMGGTFHAVANLLLRRYCRHLGYEPNFTIIDQSDAEGIVNLLKSSLNLGGANKRFPSKRVIISILSKSVNKGLSIEALIEEEYGHIHDFLDDLLIINKHYHKFKLEHGLMDYDDLLVNWRKVLTEVPEVLTELAGRFSHIMVDEYQDTNPIQADIVRLMASAHNNVMVVGDDSQSIYSFRGADFRNIMDFPKLFPQSKIIRLEENYRSTQRILDVTNAIIERAQEKFTKTLFTKIEGGDKPCIHGPRDESMQARYVADKIVALRDEGVALDEIAVLFRSGFHSYKLELELANRQIEFEKRGGLKLTESAHIKDVLSYLRVVTNPSDNLSWNRILLQLDKIGPKTAQNILGSIKNVDDPLAALAEYPAKKSWGKGLHELLALQKALRQPGLRMAGMFELVMDYYQPVFERIYHDDYPRRRKDLDQLGSIIAGYDDLQAFLDDTSLDPPQSVTELMPGAGRLILSTIHSAKGLEWDTVFIINLANGKFPSAQAILPQQREEERRLLYVAATRARKRLFFLYPREVMGYGSYGSQGGGISPFLEEIPHGLIQTTEVRKSWQISPTAYGIDDPHEETTGFGIPAIPKSKVGQSLSQDELKPGMRVRHPFFGEGKVERVAGARSFDIYFQRHGRKTLHLDYAKLEIIG